MKKSVLVIEPDPDRKATLQEELPMRTKMSVIFSSEGVISYQKARNQHFNVIVMDWKVSQLGGLQLLSSLRETNGNEKVPIIIYSNQVEEAKISTRNFQFITYLEKDTSLEKLAKKIVELSELDLEKKRFRLDVDFVNPFIDMSMKTLNSLCKVEAIKALRPYLLNENDELDIDISANLAIMSPYFRGSIAISFATDVYMRIVSEMTSTEVKEINTTNQDGAAEIINVIFGNTKAILNQRGYQLERAIPSVTRGHNHKLYRNSKIPILLVPFDSNVGKFFVQICVKSI